ncbi:hypothetical protein Pla175_29010 [Pirellulimonas nuda]|uniref:LamG-like jellyroll fold domain-containing protein n=1 Tax=Pirellulimonas nuda TaxID=2528009 RepID=A0A518DDG0_9BACT|nr:LamG domain-containing protein [Pirellulimonas nuda]QDU89509.1 hypothetical protein Pla175_29010 [Pirellulimonas nuda]
MSRFLLAVGFITLGGLLPGEASADKVHSYTFNNATRSVGGIIDSIGGVNGTLIDPAGTYGVIAGGKVDLSRNNGANSDQPGASDPSGIDVGAYIDLPNGFSNSVFATNNAATFEAWITVDQNRNFARIWDFGTSIGGENISNGGNGEYLSLAANGGAGLQFASRESSSNTAIAINQTPAGPVPVGVQSHVVVTIDGNDTSAGPAGTVKLYLNNVAVGSGKIADMLPLDDVANFGSLLPVNQWIGRSQFNNALFDGFYDEFNVYNTALTPAEIDASFVAKPAPFNGPKVSIDRSSGVVTLFNDTGNAQSLTAFSITSGALALDPSGLAPIAGWTTTSTTDGQVSQSGGTPMAIDATGFSLGTVWTRAPFQDLSLEFTLQGGGTGFAAVTYTGDPVLRSDFNLDGVVNLSDYATFLANSYKPVTAPKIDAYFLGDLDGDLDVDSNDFRLFKADFLAAGNALGALAAFEAAAVPEPSSVLLAISAAAATAVAVRRRR